MRDITRNTEWVGQPVYRERLGIKGLLTARIEVPRSELHKVEISGVREVPGRFHVQETMDNPAVLFVQRPNAFVNLGLHALLDNFFSLNSPAAVSHMGITDDDQAVTASTLLLNPAGGGSNLAIRALGTGTGAAATSRTTETVLASAGWQKSVDFAGGWWAVKKVGLLNAATDAGDDTTPTVQGVLNIIGGSGGSSPYNEPFTIDLSSTSDAKLTLTIEVTPTAT